MPKLRHPDKNKKPASACTVEKISVLNIFLIFLRLGLTSFGGPIAHLGYFQQEFVHRRKWLSEHAYADLVALCQFLPGPASSQVGIALGLGRGGILGAGAAWLGFTLPSAVFLILFGLGMAQFGADLGTGWLHGLKIVAVAVVAQALLAMGKTLCPDRIRMTVAIAAAAIAILIPSGLGQVIVITAGCILGWVLLPKLAHAPHIASSARLSRRAGSVSLLLFFGLLVALPFIVDMSNDDAIKQVSIFYRAGSLVFGGGHVVLPLLQAQLIPNGWITNDAFLAGYGATQAMPGPLFTFAAYLGSISSVQPAGYLGATLCLFAVFLPAFLLIIGVLPFWECLRRYSGMQSAMQGINAAVVGLLLAAFYDPVWTSAVHGKSDFAFACGAFMLLTSWKMAPWLVVLFSAIVGAVGNI
jgi:chromate transporter